MIAAVRVENLSPVRPTPLLAPANFLTMLPWRNRKATLLQHHGLIASEEKFRQSVVLAHEVGSAGAVSLHAYHCRSGTGTG